MTEKHVFGDGIDPTSSQFYRFPSRTILFYKIILCSDT
jgi:hypothetical protein